MKSLCQRPSLNPGLDFGMSVCEKELISRKGPQIAVYECVIILHTDQYVSLQ